MALLASDLASGTVRWTRLRRIEADPLPKKYLLADGDVVMPLRAPTPRAVVIRDVPERILAVGHWAVVSPDLKRVDPEFLGWYLNHPATRTRLTTHMRGTNLQFLSLVALRDFEVELPPLLVQRRIAHAQALNEQVAALESRIARARAQLVDGLTMSALKRAAQPEPQES